jgi:hypothetical protein
VHLLTICATDLPERAYRFFALRVNKPTYRCIMHTVVDTPGAQIDEYVSKLDVVLDSKMAVIGGLRSKLKNFRSKLQEEETLNQSM